MRAWALAHPPPPLLGLLQPSPRSGILESAITSTDMVLLMWLDGCFMAVLMIAYLDFALGVQHGGSLTHKDKSLMVVIVVCVVFFGMRTVYQVRKGASERARACVCVWGGQHVAFVHLIL